MSWYAAETEAAAGIPIQTVSASGALVIDYSLGKHVVLTLTGNVTSFSVTNWPETGTLGRLTLEVHNTGSFTISGYPASWKFSSHHTVPTITAGTNTEDWLSFTTHTAGAAVSGHWVGQDYT